MLAHDLGRLLLAGNNLRVAIVTNVRGVSVEFLSVNETETVGYETEVNSVSEHDVSSQCGCETCQRVKRAIVIFTD